MKKPKIIKLCEKNMHKDAINQITQLKKENKLDGYGEEKIVFEKGEKKLNAGDIILYKHPNASLYCKAKLVLQMQSGKQIVDFTYQDLITK